MHNSQFPRIQPLALVATLMLVFVGSDAAAESRPTITGTPPAIVVAGTRYLFRPKAFDADGQKLAFAISRKPSWAKFDSRTGRLYGTPTAANIGTYKNIRIAVSDGNTSTYLGPFRIDVKAATPGTQPGTGPGTGPGTSVGSVTLRWVAPTRNEDGSALTNLAGYRINYGTSRTALNNSITVANPGATSRTITGLAPATWYFAMTAYTNNGVESGPSITASKTIP